MSEVTVAARAPRRSAPRAIIIPGLVAGALDLVAAFIYYGPHVPIGIAGGLIGSAATGGGPVIYALGIALHFTVALIWTAIFYAASRRLVFMTEHPLVCGLVYGVIVLNVMSFIVLPLSVLHATGPYQLQEMLRGLLTHMIVIGLPIAYGVRHFSR